MFELFFCCFSQLKKASSDSLTCRQAGLPAGGKRPPKRLAGPTVFNAQ